MGIDGIGNRGGPPAPPPATGTGAGAATENSGRAGEAGKTTAKTGATFEVPAGQSAEGAAPPTGVQGADSSAAARVRSGDITLNQYLDMKVDEATAHLGGLSSTQRSQIKEALRSQMATDPALSDLVEQATGKLPEAPES